ncbi:MAG: hypothetical protein WA094_06810 [Candidatus Desulfobacillus denitrificans]|nr:hypothetical protein [Rhodocyclaceae bacterium]OQY69873.1 MAG: hypothetical protein B6D47_08420 [Rhodocyclaceae bacterium UTPRO2]
MQKNFHDRNASVFELEKAWTLCHDHIRYPVQAMSTIKTDGIVVLGPFRSGTSLACRILSGLGVDFGPEEAMLEPDPFNPQGYLQRADVRLANNLFIRSAGCTVAGPGDPERLARSGDLSILTRPDLGWRAGSPQWGIKDPRLCATLLSWLSAGMLDSTRIRIVLVCRRQEESARSMFAMPELSRLLHPRTLVSARKTIAQYAGYAAWHAKHLGLPVFMLSFEELLAHPAEQVRRLAAFAGCGNGREIEASIALVA